MAKKLNWLDKFAQEQAAKLNKTASFNKKAEQAIVNVDAVPGAQNGQVVQLMGESYRVVDANFQDDKGAGILLEKAAAASDGSYSGLESDPMGLAMGAPASSVQTPSSAGQTYHRVDPGNVYQTYDNDQDAQWGSSNAAATAQEIAGEDAVDRTNVPGHYTKSPGLGGGVAAPIGAPVGGAPVAPAQPGVVQASVEGVETVTPAAPQGAPAIGLGGGNANPQTPGIVQDNIRPEGEFGQQVMNNLQQQVAFQPQPSTPTGAAPSLQGTPVGATRGPSAPAAAPIGAPVGGAVPAAPVAPAATPATTAPAAGEVDEEVEIEEDGDDKDAVEDKKEDKAEDKMASNRILARILKAYNK